MDIMGIERVETEEQYESVLAHIRELAISEPNSESEEADIINHLSTLAAEWARENRPDEAKERFRTREDDLSEWTSPLETKEWVADVKVVDNPLRFATIVQRLRGLVSNG